MRAYPFILILMAMLTASCGGDAGEEGEASEATPATETAPVVLPDVDSMAGGAAPPDVDGPGAIPYEPMPPELGKDSIPAGSGRGKGRPPRRSDSLPAGSGRP
jgi:hypothetical protein